MDVRRLRRLFHFNEEDLAANRRGQFSKRQLQRLDAQARTEQKSGWGSALILFVIAAAGMAVGIGLGSIAPTGLGRVAMYLFMAALWPLVWVWKGIQIILAANALHDPHLSFVIGQVRVLHHGDGEYTLQVEGHEFDVDGNPTGAFTEDHEYTIYFAEPTREILSIDD